MSNSRSRPTSPSTVATSSAVMVVPANAMTWSNALCASRMLPSPARATSISAASSICDLLGVGDPAELVGDLP